jgi:hypothetical protein
MELKKSVKLPSTVQESIDSIYLEEGLFIVIYLAPILRHADVAIIAPM